METNVKFIKLCAGCVLNLGKFKNSHNKNNYNSPGNKKPFGQIAEIRRYQAKFAYSAPILFSVILSY